MAVHNFLIYTPDALDFSGNQVSLDAAYDYTQDRVEIVIDDADDDGAFGGDRFSNEDGDDEDQHATIFDLDGNQIGGGPNINIYGEEMYFLDDGNGNIITLYRVEIDSDPNSNGGQGILIGYLPTEPLDPTITYSFTTSNVTPTNELDYTEFQSVPCFTSGSIIKTPDGLRKIDDIRVGDWVHTRDHGPQMVKWVGQRRMSSLELTKSPHLAPIKIKKGAIGLNCPNRDMLVSPQHRIMLTGYKVDLLTGESEVLCPALSLVNGDTIVQAEPNEAVTYIHIMFDAHQIVTVDQCHSESFFPGDMAINSLQKATRDELFEIFPELRTTRNSYGQTARMVLRTKEAEMLCGAV